MKKIPNNRAVYRRSDGAIPLAFSGYRPAGSKAYRGGQEGENLPELSPNERIVLFELNGRKNVRQIALASGLGEFETTASLVSLQASGLVKIVSNDSSGEAPEEVSRLPELVGGLTGALLLAVFAWLSFSWSPEIWLTPAVNSEVLSDGVLAARERGLHEALSRSAAGNGYFPTRLADLEAEGWIEAEVTRPTQRGAGWRYIPSRLRDSYTLRGMKSFPRQRLHPPLKRRRRRTGTEMKRSKIERD